MILPWDKNSLLS